MDTKLLMAGAAVALLLLKGTGQAAPVVLVKYSPFATYALFRAHHDEEARSAGLKDGDWYSVDLKTFGEFWYRLGDPVEYTEEQKNALVAAALKAKQPPPQQVKQVAGPVSKETDFSRFKSPTKVRQDEERAIETSNKLGTTQWAVDRGAPPVNGKTTTGYVIGATADPTKGTIDYGVGGKVTINPSIREEQEKSKKIESGEIKFDAEKAIRDLGYVKDATGNWTPGGAKSYKGPI